MKQENVLEHSHIQYGEMDIFPCDPRSLRCGEIQKVRLEVLGKNSANTADAVRGGSLFLPAAILQQGEEVTSSCGAWEVKARQFYVHGNLAAIRIERSSHSEQGVTLFSASIELPLYSPKDGETRTRKVRRILRNAQNWEQAQSAAAAYYSGLVLGMENYSIWSVEDGYFKSGKPECASMMGCPMGCSCQGRER